VIFIKKKFNYQIVLVLFLLLPILSIYRNNSIQKQDQVVISSTSTLPSMSLQTKWTANGTAVCTEDDLQRHPQVISDMAGGAIIVWEDYRNLAKSNCDIYASRIDATGAEVWKINGTIICNETGNQSDPHLVSDGAGGAIITWLDNRGTANSDIYAQKIDKDGNFPWGNNNGTAICTEINDQGLVPPQIVTDKDGGAIIAWLDYRSGMSYDLYAQRIDKDGNFPWPLHDNNGTAICNKYDAEIDSFHMISDGAGGAIFAWDDERDLMTTKGDIYANWIIKEGNVIWALNGTAICTENEEQMNPQLTSDGDFGAIIVWDDFRSTSSYDIYTRRIDKFGNPQWNPNGNLVSLSTQMIIDNNYPKLISDGAGGAIITWKDRRNYATNGFDIYAQRISASGVIKWIGGDTAICTVLQDQENQEIVSDGEGGAIIAWMDFRDITTSSWDIYAQRVNSNGKIKWTSNGTAICTEIESQENPQLVGVGAGGAIITWEDNRNGLIFEGDIYALKIIDPSVSTLFIGGGGGGGGGGNGNKAVIPFGTYFFVFAAIGIISLIIIKQKKIHST
jgi:hypothetical protein